MFPDIEVIIVPSVFSRAAWQDFPPPEDDQDGPIKGLLINSTLLFPCFSGGSLRNTEKQNSPPPPSRIRHGRGMNAPHHVLVVEDDREIRTLMARHLRDSGCRVSLARDGREMDERLLTDRVDLVVLDVMLPGEDGLSVCRRLRAATRLPIIIVSARGSDVDRVVGLEIGADDYIAKPFNPRELVARVRALIRRSEMAKDLPERRARRLFFDG